MASFSNFGSAPEDPASKPSRGRRYVTEESGARPLPSERDGDVYDALALDEEVELPGVSRSPATLFGIGAGTGVAAIAIVAGLYYGGYLDRTMLAPSPAPTTLAADLRPFDEKARDESVALARIANAEPWAPRAVPAAIPVESPDIQVIDEGPAIRTPEPPTLARPEPRKVEPPTLTQPELPPPAQPTAPAEMPPRTPPVENPY